MNKKILLILCFILLISISTVSASDNLTSNDNDDYLQADYAESYDIVQESNYHDVLENNSYNDKLKDNGGDFKFDVYVTNAVIGEDNVRVVVDVHSEYKNDFFMIVDNDESTRTQLNVLRDYYYDIGALSAGNHTIEVIYEGDDYYKRTSVKTSFEINNIAINMPFEVNGYGNIRFAENASGYVLLYIDEKLESVDFIDNDKYVYFDLENISSGQHNYLIKYSGDGNYSPYEKTGSFNNIVYSFYVYDTNYRYQYGRDTKMHIVSYDAITGNFTVKFNDTEYIVPIKQGDSIFTSEAFFDIPELVKGNYNLSITYGGDDRLKAKTILIEFEIYYDIDIEDTYVDLILPEDAQGNLIVYVYNMNNNYRMEDYIKFYNVTLVDGKARVYYDGLYECEEYYVRAEYNGTDYFIRNTNFIDYVINPYINITVPDEIIFNQDAFLILELPENNKIGGIKVGYEVYKLSCDDFDISLLNLYVDYQKLELIYDNNQIKAKIPTSKIGNEYLQIEYNGSYLGYLEPAWDGPDFYTLDYPLKIKPLKVNITIGSDVNNSLEISVEMPADTQGTLRVDLYDHYDFSPWGYSQPIYQFESNQTLNGKTSILLNNITPDYYYIFLSYSDKYGNYYDHVYEYIGHELPKNPENPKILTTALNNFNSTVFNVELNNDASGEVVLIVDDDVYYSKINNGTASINASKLTSDTPDFTLYYSGDDNYKYSISKDLKIISDVPSSISLEMNKNWNIVNLIATVSPDNASGNVTFTVNGEKYYSVVKNGRSNITVSSSGNYTVFAEYSGNSVYKYSKSNVVNFIIGNVIILAPDVTKYYKGTERFRVTLTDENSNALANKNVSISINGEKYIKTTDNNGCASIVLGLNSGEYNVTVEYDGQMKYSKVIIKDTVIASDFSKIYKNGTQYRGTFMDSQGNLLKNTEVTLNINGVLYTRKTNDLGVARMNIKLNAGKYVLTATNPSTGEQHATTITVLPNIVENKNLTKYYRNSSQYIVRLLDDTGKPVGKGVNVTFNINGVFYTRTTNENGYARLNINLGAGDYIITAEYKGHRESNKIKVLPILKADDLYMSYLDGSQFKARLVDGQGNALANKKVTFNINGVLYQRTTGSTGIAKLNIKLMAGKYIITSSYNGCNIANEVTINSVE